MRYHIQPFGVITWHMSIIRQHWRRAHNQALWAGHTA